jgi:hypothetical protein
LTALALVGIVLFGVAVAVIAVGMVRDTVRNVRELRRSETQGTQGGRIMRLSGGTHRTLVWRRKSDEVVFPRGSAEESDLPPRPSKAESNVPPGWGFD